jgi:sugar lactone lactonase YvrE
MRRLLLCALVVAGCGGSNGLGANDVELTINTRAAAVNDQDLATVTALELTLSGSQNDHTRYDLTRPFNRAETLVVHLTKSTGDLTIAVLARDANGLVVALGFQKQTLSGNDPHVIDVDLEAPPSGTHAPSAISISPSSSLQIFSKQTVAFTASAPVTWSVTAGGAGGTIDDTGLYTAPAGAGSDEVTAVSPLYFGQQASINIDVLTSGALRYAGLPAGSGTVDGAGPAARISYPRSIVIDNANNVYFTETTNVVRKMDANGNVTTIAGGVENGNYADGTGSAAGFVSPWGIAWDQARNALYVADVRTIRKLDLATNAVTTIAGANNMSGGMDGTGSGAQFWNVWGLAYANDHIYAVEPNGNTIRDIDVTTGVVATVVGSAFMSGYVDGAGTTARLNNPLSEALDGQGHLYIAEFNNALIRSFDIGSKMVSTLTGRQGIQGNVNGPKGTATINYPIIMAYGSGALYLDGRRVNVSDGSIVDLHQPGVDGFPTDSIAFAPDGKLWAATDTALATIDPAKWQFTVVAGVRESFNDLQRVDGSRWVARFNQPQSVAAAPDGTLLVLDGEGLRRIDPTTDTVKTIFVAPSYLGGPAGITIAGDGTVYLAWSGAIYSLSPSESYSQMHLVTGVPGTYAFKDGPLLQAQFANPTDIAVVGKVLYVADTGNNIIRAVDLNAGMVSTFAGTANMGGLVDMPGAAARFNGPQGITYDGSGVLYVASNNAVRKIVISGAVVSTLAGGDISGTGDGTGTAAKFNFPAKLRLDPQKQNLYVADMKGTAIRKVNVASGAVTTVAGTPGKVVLTPGALPASINEPVSLAFMPSGDLLVVVQHEQSLVQIRLP